MTKSPPTKPKKLLNHSTILADLHPGFVVLSQPLNCFSPDPKAVARAEAVANSMIADQESRGTPCKLVRHNGKGYVMRSVNGYLGEEHNKKARTGSHAFDSGIFVSRRGGVRV